MCVSGHSDVSYLISVQAVGVSREAEGLSDSRGEEASNALCIDRALKPGGCCHLGWHAWERRGEIGEGLDWPSYLWGP